MEYSEIIRERILTLCREQKLSINRLASLSGLPQSTIDNIVQRSTKYPSIATIHRIANAFGMTPAEFLNTTEINEFEFE